MSATVRDKLINEVKQSISEVKRAQTEHPHLVINTDEHFQFDNLPAQGPTKDALSPEMTVIQHINDLDYSPVWLSTHKDIQKVFTKHNTSRPSSGAVERLFSFARMIHYPKKAKLSNGLFETLTILKTKKQHDV